MKTVASAPIVASPLVFNTSTITVTFQCPTAATVANTTTTTTLPGVKPAGAPVKPAPPKTTPKAPKKL